MEEHAARAKAERWEYNINIMLKRHLAKDSGRLTILLGLEKWRGLLQSNTASVMNMHTSDFGLDTMEMTCESQNSKWPHSIYRCAETPLGATCMKLRNQ